VADWGTLQSAKNGLIKRRTKEVAFYFGATSGPYTNDKNYLIYYAAFASLALLTYKIFKNSQQNDEEERTPINE
jgi:hypothetical protein